MVDQGFFGLGGPSAVIECVSSGGGLIGEGFQRCQGQSLAGRIDDNLAVDLSMLNSPDAFDGFVEPADRSDRRKLAGNLQKMAPKTRICSKQPE